MTNILDYLDWRGDITFYQSAFNDVDNLILSQLSYIDFNDIVPKLESDESITLSEASKRLFSVKSEDEIYMGLILPRDILKLFKRMAETKRFKNSRLTYFVNEVDIESQKQFAAITIHLDDDTIYIAFRGTDDTLIGWKEDFNMLFKSPIPSQLRAVEYLKFVATKKENQLLRVGGHSKGGNLAVYASIYCDDSIKERIINIYNNDGPGLNEDDINDEEYHKVIEKMTTIVPETSIVGMLFEHLGNFKIVKSSQRGLFQHDGFSWDVIRDHFVELEALSKESDKISESIMDLIKSLNFEQREQFVEGIYGVLSATNKNTLTELNADKLKLINFYNKMDHSARRILLKVLFILIKNRAIR